jgi:hypothetical protein
MLNSILHKVNNCVTFETSKTAKTEVACKKKLVCYGYRTVVMDLKYLKKDY